MKLIIFVFSGQQQQFHFGFGQRAFLGGYSGALDHLNRSADFAMTLSRMPNCQSKQKLGPMLDLDDSHVFCHLSRRC